MKGEMGRKIVSLTFTRCQKSRTLKFQNNDYVKSVSFMFAVRLQKGNRC